MQVCHFFATTGCKHPQACTKGSHDGSLVLPYLDSIVCKRLAFEAACTDKECKKSHFPAILSRFKDELAKSQRVPVARHSGSEAAARAPRPATAQAAGRVSRLPEKPPSLSLVPVQPTSQSSKSCAIVAKLSGMGMKPVSKSEHKTEVSVKQKRRKTNVIVAVDLGSSMAGPHIEFAKQELKKLWHLLDKGDSLSIITFAEDVAVAMPRCYKWMPKDGQVKRDSQFDARDLDRVVGGLVAKGRTALFDALLTAMQLTQQACENDMREHPNSDWHTYQLLVITAGTDSCSKSASAAAVNSALLHPGAWAGKCHFSTCFVSVSPGAAIALQPCTMGLKHSVTVSDIGAGFRRVTETVAQVRTSSVQKLKKSVFEWGKVFNATAGQTRFDKSLPRDQFRNVVGVEFDLSPDGAFSGNKIAVYQAYIGENFTFQEPKQALEQKGFEVVLWHGQLPSLEDFSKTLGQCCQLWLISGDSVTLSEGYMQAVLKFVETPQCEGESDMKKGLFIWGDNDPYNADANAVLQRLPFFKGSVRLNGNYMADHILTEHPAPTAMRGTSQSGFKPHFITTGLESLYEGITISDVRDPQHLCEPIITCSDQKSHVTCLHNSGTHRILIDGGFTRLYPDRWARTAGTSRFVTNAACFLANPFAGQGG